MSDARSFSATVDAWCQAVPTRLQAVFRESVRRTVVIMQTPVGSGGNMPIDTGFLRASIRGSLQHMPQLTERNSVAAKWAYDAGAITLVIASAELGQTIYIGYTANYAAFVEYGTKHTPPRGYRAYAVGQWQATVSAVVHDLKTRVAARQR